MRKREIFVLVSIIILDLYTKSFIENSMELWQSIPVIPGFFYISYIQNIGAAWGIFGGSMWFFYLMTFIGIVLLSYWFYRTKKTEVLYRFSIILMIAGTLGNFHDRLRFQYVRDFLDFYIFGYDFPAFNVADMSLCIGVFLMAVSIFWEEKKEKNGR